MGSKSAKLVHPRQVALWLLACCCMIYMMVVIGGVTRLTHSGLSMVEWKPIMGIVPPLSQAEWADAFKKYPAYPEYKVRHRMSLAEFKAIFYVEYFHRVFGRTIGLVFLLPFLFFLLRRRLDRRLLPHLVGVFVLGGLQGIMGWYMVQSGLIDIPRVSPYRLTAHLGLAFFLYGYVLWLALDLLGLHHANYAPNADSSASSEGNSEGTVDARLRRWSLILLGAVTIMFLSGGFVAGNRAGHAFNTFPLMNGALLPAGLFNLKPWYLNFFENNLMVQFEHRLLAYSLCVLVPLAWWRCLKLRSDRRLRIIFYACMGCLLLQVTLGVITLLMVVPVSMAAAHQAGALLLFTSVVVLAHYLKSAQA